MGDFKRTGKVQRTPPKMFHCLSITINRLFQARKPQYLDSMQEHSGTPTPSRTDELIP